MVRRTTTYVVRYLQDVKLTLTVLYVYMYVCVFYFIFLFFSFFPLSATVVSDGEIKLYI